MQPSRYQLTSAENFDCREFKLRISEVLVLPENLGAGKTTDVKKVHLAEECDWQRA